MEKVTAKFSEEQKALEELEKGYSKAEEILKNPERFERLMQRLEKKLKVIPKVGDKLAKVPIMASLIKSFVKKEYTDIPIGSVIAIISALIYFVSPIDLIPDWVPGAGYIDDALVVVACLKMVESDIDEYTKWRKGNGKVIDLK